MLIAKETEKNSKDPSPVSAPVNLSDCCSKRFLGALFLSLILHYVFLSNSGGWYSRQIAPTGPLHLRLATAKSSSSPLAASQSLLNQAIKEAAVDRRQPLPAITGSDQPRLSPPQLKQGDKAIPPPIPSPAPIGGIKNKSQNQVVEHEQLPALEAPQGIDQAGPKGPPKNVEIEFALFSGGEALPMGSGRHHYATFDGGNYELKVQESIAESNPENTPRWRLAISGRITSDGLSPTLYEKRGKVSERLLGLNDNPKNHSPDQDEMQAGRMPDGILDRQSLLYQFMLRPPKENAGKVLLTDGNIYKAFTYKTEGTELLNIAAMGNVQTVKILLKSKGVKELIELWLMPEKRFLPARMRYTDESGQITDLIVLSLSFD